jgi:hypothetical protein
LRRREPVELHGEDHEQDDADHELGKGDQESPVIEITRSTDLPYPRAATTPSPIETGTIRSNANAPKANELKRRWPTIGRTGTLSR